MPVFIGERYIPQADRKTALAQAERIRVAVGRLAPVGSPVRLLSTTFVPNEEWAFDLFEADSAGQVERVYEESAVAVQRVTEGVHLPGHDRVRFEIDQTTTPALPGQHDGEPGAQG